MSYIELFFGKKAQDLLYQDVLNYFIEEQQESDKIEFKSYNPKGEFNTKIDGISRTICGFLNSSGGLVIWGAPEGQRVEGKNEPIYKGELRPIDRFIEKDSFINKISNLITPSPNFVRFFPFEKSGGYVYLIEVEQSEYSPHQYKDIYYMRIDGQTKAAPHHYIEALFKKITFPKLKGYISLSNYYSDGSFYYLTLTAIVFNLSKMQNENKPFCKMVVSEGSIFSQYKYFPDQYGLSGHQFIFTGGADRIFYNQPLFNSQEIKLNYHELKAINSELKIFLFIGGENSPMLLSEYKVRINFNAIKADPNSFIVSKDENRYWFEHSDELGVPEEERISNVIGRKI